MNEYTKGLKSGLAIGLGYLPVAFSFGMMASAAGVPIWASLAISMANLTSAGQFAGLNIIIASGGMWELAMAQLVINLRYMLMSLVLSQKIKKMSLAKRLIAAFGITDEIFSVAATRQKKITFSFMMGLLTLPYLGWSLGTLLGATAAGLMPEALSSAMGITLYAMFLAIFIPVSVKNKGVMFAVIIACFISSIIYFVFPAVSTGWSVIIASVISAGMAAALFPQDTEDLL